MCPLEASRGVGDIELIKKSLIHVKSYFDLMDKNIFFCFNQEVLHFATNCPSCGAPAQTNMKERNLSIN